MLLVSFQSGALVRGAGGFCYVAIEQAPSKASRVSGRRWMHLRLSLSV